MTTEEPSPELYGTYRLLRKFRPRLNRLYATVIDEEQYRTIENMLTSEDIENVILATQLIIKLEEK